MQTAISQQYLFFYYTWRGFTGSVHATYKAERRTACHRSESNFKETGICGDTVKQETAST